MEMGVAHAEVDQTDPCFASRLAQQPSRVAAPGGCFGSSPNRPWEVRSGRCLGRLRPRAAGRPSSWASRHVRRRPSRAERRRSPRDMHRRRAERGRRRRLVGLALGVVFRATGHGDGGGCELTPTPTPMAPSLAVAPRVREAETRSNSPSRRGRAGLTAGTVAGLRGRPAAREGERVSAHERNHRRKSLLPWPWPTPAAADAARKLWRR
jgi:hypothetical protein